MAGADEAYLQRYIEELPRAFNPKKIDPPEWARLARLAGFKYVVFTTKHHSGFCMYDTETTDFNIMNTPYGKDITKELFDAFRAEGLAIGHYFSPDDFHFLYKQGTLISRLRPEVLVSNNKELHEFDKAQMRELMTNYGKIDMVFFDPPTSVGRNELVKEMKQIIWDIDPKTIVTRGEMETPEQYTSGVPLEGAWEGNLTMGGQWQYRGTNERYKSGRTLINTWIETRAKGGNLLLNIGPKPDGEIPIEQEARMREMALWRLVNEEAVGAVRPWVITNEGDIWFTKAKEENSVYAFVTNTDWPWGAKKTITLTSVRATEATKASVLGQNDIVLEYRPDVTPKTEWEQIPDGLRVTAYRAQRLYNDRSWPNPVVIKLTNVEAGLQPPVVETSDAEWGVRGATFRGELRELGDAASLQVGFEYRKKKSTAEMYEPDDPWKPVSKKKQMLSAPGGFSAELRQLDPNRDWEYRAVVKHPKVTLYGMTAELTSR
jgi:alpha-L-fucosidase